MSPLEPRTFHQSFLPEPTARAFVWKYSQAIGGRRPRHFHIEPELNLVIRGSATFAVGRRVAEVSAGELLVFPPGQDHALLEGSSDLYLYAVGLDPDFSAQILGPEHAAGLPLHIALAPRERAILEARAAAVVERDRAESLTAELWERSHWLGRHTPAQSGRAVHTLTRRTMQLLAKSPELSLDAVASCLKAHPSEVSRQFHHDMGVTLVRYRTRLRLLRFIRSVDGGKRDLMDSASAAGFGSYSQAHRSFRSELGCGPRQFFDEGARDRMQSAYI